MDTGLYEKLKKIYLSTKKDIVMDDWDAAYNAGIQHAVNQVMLDYYTYEDIGKFQTTWESELKKEKNNGT